MSNIHLERANEMYYLVDTVYMFRRADAFERPGIIILLPGQ